MSGILDLKAARPSPRCDAHLRSRYFAAPEFARELERELARMAAVFESYAEHHGPSTSEIMHGLDADAQKLDADVNAVLADFAAKREAAAS